MALTTASIARTGIIAAFFGLVCPCLVNAEDVPSGVLIELTEAGRYFTTNQGRTLYWSQNELSARTTVCIEDCLKTWRPLVAASSAAEVPQGWSVVKRPDDSLQWAYDGKPLYTFAGDTFPGSRLGAYAGFRQATFGQWNLLFEPTELPAGLSLQPSLLGRVLADYKGRTVYSRSQSAASVNGRDFSPLLAPWLAELTGDWSFIPLQDGSRQWAYKGQALYLFENDKDAQDTKGHGVNGIWSAVILEPPPGLPPWMTIQRVDLGWVFADQNGMTIYAPANLERINAAKTCTEDCMNQYWRPVLASPDEAPVGRWSIIERDDGRRQWTFLGRPLFTHTRDSKPGEMTGNSFAVGYAIGDGFRVILIESNLPPAI